MYTRCNREFCQIQRMLDWYANFNKRSTHHGVGFFAGWNSQRVLISSGTEKKLAFARNWVGALRHISNTLCGRHIVD